MSFTYSSILWKQIALTFQKEKVHERYRMVFVSNSELFFMTPKRSYRIMDMNQERDSNFILYKVNDEWPFTKERTRYIKPQFRDETLVFTNGQTEWVASSNVGQRFFQRNMALYQAAYAGFQPSIDVDNKFGDFNWNTSDVILPAFNFIEAIGRSVVTSKLKPYFPIAFYSPRYDMLGKHLMMKNENYGFYLRSQMVTHTYNIGIDIKFKLKSADLIEQEIKHAMMYDISPPKLND